MLDSNRVARRKEAVRRSFEELDKDGDGFITAEDLVKVGGLGLGLGTGDRGQAACGANPRRCWPVHQRWWWHRVRLSPQLTSPSSTRTQVMPRGSSIELAREMVDEVDRNGDGRVDYNEFQRMMQS